jgi:hypothetical protein
MKEELMTVVIDFELAKSPSQTTTIRKVRDKAPKIGEQLLNISENNIDLGHKIIKYEYAAYAFFMAAHYANSDDLKRRYSDKSIDLAKRALDLIYKALDRASDGSIYYQDLQKFIKDDYEEERVLFTIISSVAINISSQGNYNTSEIHKYLARVDELNSSYFDSYPLTSNGYVKAVFNKYKIRRAK